MALLCNAFDDATLSDTACQLNNNGFCYPNHSLTWEQIAILALDALVRTQTPQITALDSTEAQALMQNAWCALENISVPEMDEDKLKAALLFVVNEVACG